MKTLIISDLHLGSPLFNSQNRIIELLDYNYKEIFILGDIIDIWEAKFVNIIDMYQPLIDMINKKSNEIPVTIIKGNHDPCVFSLQSVFTRCNIVDGEAYIGDDIVLVHGNEFDHLITDYSWLANFLFSIHKVLERFGINLRETFRDLFYSIASKKDKNYFTDLVLRVEKETCNKYKDKYKTIIMGHTHLPKIAYYPNSGPSWKYRYINSGDWIHNKTFIIKKDDEFNVYEYIP